MATIGVFAYCCRSFAVAARSAAGVDPVTCPPASAATFVPSALEGHDLIYFDLHGHPGDPAWYGDDKIIALQAEQLAGVDLGRAVVFAVNCFLADENSPLMDALLSAGARYVIGGDGPNWGPDRGPLYGAPLLGKWIRRCMGLGMDPLRGLKLGKMAVRLRRRASADTLAFRAYCRKDDTQ